MRSITSAGDPGRTLLFIDIFLLAICFVLGSVVFFLAFSDLGASVTTDRQSKTHIAKLTRANNRVRLRVDGMLAWNEAGAGASIYKRDAIYVGADSDAIVSFSGGSQIEIEENSLLVISLLSDTHSKDDLKGTDILVDVLRGSTLGKAVNENISIRAGNNLATIKKGSKASILLHRNRTAQIDVKEGSALVSAGGQSQATLATGHRQFIDKNGKTAATQKLSVTLVAPSGQKPVFFTGSASVINFAWKVDQEVDSCRFELSQDLQFNNIVETRDLNRLATEVPNLNEGIYHWRVKCKNDQGEMVSEERKLALIADTAPAIYSPRSGETVFAKEPMTVLFAWSAIDQVQKYQVEISRDEKILVQTRTDRPSFSYQSQPHEGAYCFRVRADDPRRGNSPWSEKTCIRVITRAVPRAPKLYKPKVEEIPLDEIAPEPKETSWFLSLFESVAYADGPKARALVLRWEAIPGVESYIIQIAEDRGFKEIVVKKRVSHNYYRWRRLTQRNYFWRVKSIDESGREGEFSAPKPLGAVVSPPILASPKAGASFEYTGSGSRVVLTWKGSNLLSRYIVEVSNNPGFSSKTTKLNSLKQQVAYELPGPGKFYWRVVGVDLNGQTINPSKTRSFNATIGAPVLKEPKKGKTYPRKDKAPSVQLSWGERPVDKYEVQFAFDPEFQKNVSKKVLSDTKAVFRPKRFGTFYWRVRSVEPKGPWSRVNNIRVIPDAPRPSAPSNDARISSRNDTTFVELSWQLPSRASGYKLEIRALDSTDPKQIKRLKGEGSSVKVEDLAVGKHTWKVWAVHSSGEKSRASREFKFEIVRKALPETPILSTPAQGIQITSLEAEPVLFSWQPVKKAGSYEFELASSEEFTESTDRRKIRESSISVPVSTTGTVFWRVRTVAEDGAFGNWSDLFSFDHEVMPKETAEADRQPLPESEEDSAEDTLYVGPRVALFYNFGEVITAQFGAELGIRPPILDRRLGVTISASYYTFSADASDPQGEISAESRIHSVPIELMVTYKFLTKVVDPYLGVGFHMSITHETVSISGQSDLGLTETDFGGLALVGVERLLGPGFLFAELSYVLTTKSDALVEVDPSGLALDIGYRIGLF